MLWLWRMLLLPPTPPLLWLVLLRRWQFNRFWFLEVEYESPRTTVIESYFERNSDQLRLHLVNLIAHYQVLGDGQWQSQWKIQSCVVVLVLFPSSQISRSISPVICYLRRPTYLSWTAVYAIRRSSFSTFLKGGRHFVYISLLWDKFAPGSSTCSTADGTVKRKVITSLTETFSAGFLSLYWSVHFTLLIQLPMLAWNALYLSLPGRLKKGSKKF